MTLHDELKKLAADWRRDAAISPNGSAAKECINSAARGIESILARHPEESPETPPAAMNFRNEDAPIWFVFVSAEGDRTCFVCGDEIERDTVTLREIFGNAPVDQQHVEYAQAIIRELTNTNEIDFEDGAIQWECAEAATVLLSQEDRLRRLESEKSPLPNPPGPVKV